MALAMSFMAVSVLSAILLMPSKVRRRRRPLPVMSKRSPEITTGAGSDHGGYFAGHGLFLCTLLLQSRALGFGFFTFCRRCFLLGLVLARFLGLLFFSHLGLAPLAVDDGLPELVKRRRNLAKLRICRFRHRHVKIAFGQLVAACETASM